MPANEETTAPPPVPADGTPAPAPAVWSLLAIGPFASLADARRACALADWDAQIAAAMESGDA